MAKGTATDSQNAQEEKSSQPASPKSQRISQSVLPVASFFQSLRVARAIWDQLAGDGGRPLEVAAALGVQPTGGSWKNITGAAIAFGLTDGGYNAAKIKLLPLGRRCVAPEEDGDDVAAMIEAYLKPTLIKSFLEKYDGKKFPNEQIGSNVIVGLGYPKDRAPAAFSLITADAEKLGILREIKGERYVDLQARAASSLPQDSEIDSGVDDADEDDPQHIAKSLPFLAKKMSLLRCRLKRYTAFLSHMEKTQA